MSDQMMGGRPPMPPQGGGMGGPPPGGGMDVRSKMSIMNPTDMAAKASRGDVRPQQSVGEFLQRNYGVTPQDPVEKLFAAVKGQAQNATVAGKMGMPPQGARPPQARPPMGGGGMPPGGQPPPRSMDDLVGRMGGM